MKRALIVWGGWDGHQPQQCAELVGGWLTEAGFAVRIERDLAAFADPALMTGLDLAIPMWTMGELPAESFTGLSNAVAAGCGLGGWHGGMCDAFRTNTEYQFMTGGQWVAHPGGIIDYTVRVTDHGHPITANVADFAIRSEQYYLHTDPGNQVLATTVFSGAHDGKDWLRGVEMPVAWVRRWYQGRVFYCACGHVADDLRVPAVQRLVLQGLRWAAKDL